MALKFVPCSNQDSQIQSPPAIMNAKNPVLKAPFTNFYYGRTITKNSL